jgi:hypothetical protein
MRKLYSIVLMATALLIGTNVKAGVSDFAGLQKAINEAVAGTPTSIVLDDDISATSSISVTDGKKIEIDLNGHNITSTAAGANMLNIDNGSLSLENSKSVGGTISGEGTYAIASMRGSNEDVANFSVLNVGAGVTLTSDGSYGINMFQYRYWDPTVVDKKTKEVVGGWIQTKYGYGMVLNVAGTVYSPNGHGVWVLGNIKETNGTNHSQINVLPSGSITGDNRLTTVAAVKCTKKTDGSWYIDSEGKSVYVYNLEVMGIADPVAAGSYHKKTSCGLYGGGYALYNIQGSVSGGNGIYMKGGHLVVDGGNISATASEYWKPLYYGNGFISAGSAIVLDNNAGYAPIISMQVTGNAVVSSETGMAIEELVTSGEEKITAQEFVIESGTFVSGTDQNNVAHDAVTVTDKLGNEVKTEGTVSGGMFSTPVDNVLSVTGETTTVTIDGVDYQVIHEAVDPLDVKTLADATISDPVKMDGTAATYTVASGATAKAKYLELANGATVTVEGTLVIGVEGVVIKDASKITVKAGGKLVINAGIITTSADQLVVEASETNSGVLVAAPGVTWNAQPLATVQFYTFAKQYSATNHTWQRIATPLSHYDAISNDFAAATQDGNPFTTWVRKWNGSNWETVSAWADLKAFSGYALSNNSINGGVTYSFKGNIQGGVSSELNFTTNGLNFFGNSYIAPIKVVPMLQQMVAAGADDAFHIWNAKNQKYDAGSSFYAKNGLCPDEIPATQTFVMNLREGTSASADLDYANSVWAPYASLASGASSAPKRVMPANNLTFVQINIAGADGDADKVILTEGEQFSDEFDNGADIVKYMNENRLNVYVEGAENYAAAASNDILGTTLAIQAQNNINYTMTFSNVMGEGYAIKDMMTGVVTDMVEGNEYRFVAQPNATTEGRFQIVERNNAPTAIDNTEVKANVKGIYSITGMYLGEDFKALPAGVYVVDGVKIVK